MSKWLKTWDSKGRSNDFLVQTGRGNSFDLKKFLLFMQDVERSLRLRKPDTLLDIGGASGWISLWLSPFVRSVTMFDYSKEMILKAQKQTAGFDNITVFQDDILSMANIKEKYNKVLVGSVLQYLNNMGEVKTAMQNIYNVMEPGGIALFTHNPDLNKKASHIASVPQTEESLKMENERLWMDKNQLCFMALKIGFKETKITPINPLIWQSSHMFDFVLTK
jgi:protein-L-isoaspartate O-methyltransferase